MNIAIVGKFNAESFGLHIEETFIQMGHSVIRVDPQVNFLQYKIFGFNFRKIAKSFYINFLDKVPAIRRFKSKKIYKSIEEDHLDMILVLHDFLSPEEIHQIKARTSAAVCIWFPDHLANFQKSMFYLADYDYLFFKDRYTVSKLRDEMNLNAFYLPQCCNPNSHRKVNLSQNDLEEYSCEITNAGNLYPSRAALYKNLTQYDFKMWGGRATSWLKVPELKRIIMGRAVFNEDKCKAFSAAKIVLNNLHIGEIDGLNKRTFEIPACGGFQIVSLNNAVSTHFEIGKEIEVYTNLEDLKQKIEFYLDPQNEEKRKKIIEAGYDRTMKDHTYEIRLSEMLKVVFHEN